MLKIGITSSVPYGPSGAIHDSVVPYVRAVERAGGEAVLLPNEAGRLEEVFDGISAVVFSGGVDVDVAAYGGRAEHARSQAWKYRPKRDRFEIALAHATRERAMPALCICRGLQVVNVAFGGTLIEDVREELAERYTIDHLNTDALGVERSDYARGHDVTIDADSAFARLVSRTRIATNSMHHQAVRALGDGLVAVGRTSDGVIEAVDAGFAHPFFYGVQWHPEELDDDVSARLFDGLLDAARRRT